jgi:hypothetical protein
MAEADTDPTRTSSDWLLIVEDVFPRWRDRTGSSKDGKAEVDALLCDPETHSAIHKVDASGKEIPGTSSYVDDPGFWPDCLVLVRDADGGADHLVIDYPDPIYLDLPDGHWEGFVRRLDVERHERRYFPMTAAPPSEELSNKPRQKPGPKPDFDWGRIETKGYALMDHHGDFMPDDPEWDCQARLEEALMMFCQNEWQRQPAPSTLREKLPGWLLTWHKRKTGAA